MNRKLFAATVFAAAIAIKLPYQAGQRFVVVQGYDSPPTHIKKDLYAIDFSQDGCDAYGKLALAAGDGMVMLAQESGYNGGYGTQVLIVNASRVVTRYAHMIPGTIPVAEGDTVVQGEPLGQIGNTGLVAGAACPIHPGTHIHFAMYGENTDGSFSPYRPEPISNYVGITQGRWYLSDNTIAITTIPGASAILERAMQLVFGSGSGSGSGPSISVANVAPATVSVDEITNATTATVATGSINGSGGSGSMGSVSATPPPEQMDLPSSPVTPPAVPDEPVAPPANTYATSPPSPPTILITTTSFDTSTLAIDLSWQASGTAIDVSGTPVYQIFSVAPAGSTATSTLIATTTATTFSYPLSESDFGATSSLQFEIVAGPDNDMTATTVPMALPNWATAIQPVDTANSNGSWYSDNWYDLGTGFYGVIRSLTFEGFIDDSLYFSSHLYLDEYLDPDYTELNQTYTISNKAPFTNDLRKITIAGLDIPLQPNKYYRLRTYQDFQNRSVILTGTSATGTAMWDGYIYGVGIVRNEYPFYPYLSALMIPDYPPLQPPNQVPSLSTRFDQLDSRVGLSWPAATDPDTTSSLLRYQINIATTTGGANSAFNDATWQSIGKNLTGSFPVTFGNAYTVGVRAVDDLGNIGPVSSEPWSFPAGYAPAPEQIDHSVVIGGYGSAQEIAFLATTTVSAVSFWADGQYGGWCCSDIAVSIHENNGGTIGAMIAESDTLMTSPYPGGYEHFYSFASPPILSPGEYWFSIDQPTNLNGIEVFGSATDSYPDGYWSASPTQDAYFRIQEATPGP